jgi:N-acetyltransferase
MNKPPNPHKLLTSNLVTMGVRQIWVHAKYRRGGIAQRLLDVARKHFVFGAILQRNHIAFSQPTTDGLRFALAYTKSSKIWGYSF